MTQLVKKFANTKENEWLCCLLYSENTATEIINESEERMHKHIGVSEEWIVSREKEMQKYFECLIIKALFKRNNGGSLRNDSKLYDSIW